MDLNLMLAKLLCILYCRYRGFSRIVVVCEYLEREQPRDRPTRSEGGQPGGGEAGSGPKPLVHVRQWGAAPYLLAHVGRTHPLCEGNLTVRSHYLPEKRRASTNQTAVAGSATFRRSWTNLPAPLQTGPTCGTRRK
ncbi:hypothetical protein B296_00054780 [Ensete ventricosum]|uniref:Uncharacterized protein n=1 Tax=Ensete ventricosum TaxID=4639 RepID=A0A426Y342_ENSVE|nr:hypothetical protein B296_00054780 [Ensete ventricosum]